MMLTKLGALVAGAVLVVGACSSGGSIRPRQRRSHQGHDQDRRRPSAFGQRSRQRRADPQRHPAGRRRVAMRRRRHWLQGRDQQAGRRASTACTIPSRAPATPDPRRGRGRSWAWSVPSTRTSLAREIPVTNEAGLAQCSPANTGVDLTKEGSEELPPGEPGQAQLLPRRDPGRHPGPGRRAVRLQRPRRRPRRCVMDDTEAFGVGVANTFTEEFKKLGGTIVKRDSNDFKTNTDFARRS